MKKIIPILAALLACGAAPAQGPQQWHPVFIISMANGPAKDTQGQPLRYPMTYIRSNPPSGSWASCEVARKAFRPVLVKELSAISKAFYYVDECRKFTPFTK